MTAASVLPSTRHSTASVKALIVVARAVVQQRQLSKAVSLPERVHRLPRLVVQEHAALPRLEYEEKIARVSFSKGSPDVGGPHLRR